MSMTTLLGLSFGVFPCLLFGFIMLLSLLICEYIEEYVANHICAWKNRRRRGLRSFYRDFRERRNSQDNMGTAQHFTSSRTRCYSSSSNAWVGGGGVVASGVDVRYMPTGNIALPPSAPPSERSELYGAQASSYSSNYQLLPIDDSPPSYEECVLPRVRFPSCNNGNNRVSFTRSPNPHTSSTNPNKPSVKKTSSLEKDMDKDKR